MTDATARFHVRFGWLALAVFVTVGLVLEALHGVGAEAAAGLRAIGPKALGSIAGRLQKLNAEGVPVALSGVDLCQIVLTTCITLALSYASELTSEMAEFLMQAATTYSSPPPPSPHSRRTP